MKRNHLFSSKLFCLFLLFPLMVIFSAIPVYAQTVGYYDMNLGQGNSNQVPPITAVGYTPVLLNDVAAADLVGINILFVQNPSNSTYGAEYMSRLTDIQNAVQNGMVLIIHDRRVTEAATVVPNGAGFSFFRDFSDDEDIDIRDNSTLVTNGPAGTLDNTSLDGGSSSSHGYADASSLPGSAVLILSTSSTNNIVTFAYPEGSGWVIYSTIPLDFYLAGSGPNPPRDNLRFIYSPNVLAYANQLGGSCTSPTINQHPQDQEINYGETVTLSVRATGTSPRFYWYQGTSGDRSNKIEGANSENYTTPPLTETTSFWVEVVNACGAAQSQTAVVTVKISAFPPLEAQLQRVENSFIFYTRFVNRLTWQANPANVVSITNYRIYRKVKGADDTTYQLVGEVSGSTLGYDDRGLDNNDFFAYRITSVNERGDESTPVELSN